MANGPWTCPGCGAILAPHQDTCPYCNHTNKTTITNDDVNSNSKETKLPNAEALKAKITEGFEKFGQKLEQALTEFKYKAFEEYVKEHSEQELIDEINRIKGRVK